MKKRRRSKIKAKVALTTPNTKSSEIVVFVPAFITTDIPALSHDQLIKALYWIWDAFDRSLINMFLVYKTAEDVMAHKDLEGDSVHVGVRKLEWMSGSKTIFDNFAGTPNESTDELVTYDFQGTPVYVHIFEEDECIRATDSIMYEAEQFKLPNPYSKFIELYPWK